MPEAEADYTIDWDEPVPAVTLPPPRPAKAQAAIPAKADRALARVQATAAEKNLQPPDDDDEVTTGSVIASGDRVTLLGQEFRVSERIGLMPLLKFASASDVDTQDPRALAAMYTMLRDCIYEGSPGCGECEHCEARNETACKAYERGDWSRFEEHAMVTKADADDLMGVVSKVLEIASGRPTPPRGGSPATARRTRAGLTASGSATRKRGSRR